jgi:hypothetical protein
MSFFLRPPIFSKDTPNKISKWINVFGKNTLIRTINQDWSVAIADEPIDAKADGKYIFGVRGENLGEPV